MKVGIFCPTFNVYGGGEFVAATMARALSQSNYDVVIYTNEEISHRKTAEFFGETLAPSTKVIVKHPPFHSKGVLDFYQTILRSEIFARKCDIWIDTYSCRIFPWTNISYIHFPFLNTYSYNPKFPYLKNKDVMAISGLPYCFLERNFLKYDGKLMLANSYYTAKEVEKFSGHKATVLYPPVSSNFFRDNSEELSEAKRKDLVVTVSRFGPNKSLERILYIALLTGKNIKFAIIGRKHDEATLFSLQKLANKLDLTDKVSFFPDLSKREMKRVLKNAKVYLHTKVAEHFGISIVEAMAMGCVPIVHDSGGAREFVPEAFRYRNIYEAAEKICREIDGWSSKKAIMLTKIAERFKEENFSNEFLKLFERYRTCLH